MTITRRRGTMAAVIVAAILVGMALTLVESVGLILAIAFWAVAAFLFGNWYRTSTTPARVDDVATIREAHTVDGLTVSWTAEGAKSYGTPAIAQEAAASR